MRQPTNPPQNPFLPMLPPDLEIEDVDLEFLAYTLRLPKDTPLEVLASYDKKISELMNEGWRINEFMPCRPFLTIVFHREKEIPQNDQQ